MQLTKVPVNVYLDGSAGRMVAGDIKGGDNPTLDRRAGMPKKEGVVKFTLYIPEEEYGRAIAVVAARKQSGNRSASVNKLAIRGFLRELEQEEAELGLETGATPKKSGRNARPS
jgi:hypothetical protein